MIELFLFLNIIASILLFTSYNQRGNFFLGLLLLLNVYQGFSALFLTSNYSNEIRALFFLNLAPITLLIGPSLYFYTIKKLNPEYQIRIYQLLHLLPSLYFFIQNIPYLSLSLAEKIQLLKRIDQNAQYIFEIKLLVGESVQLFFFRPFHILIYIIICLYLINRKKSNFNSYLSLFRTRLITRWMKQLLYSLAIMHVCNAINMFYIYFNEEANIKTPLPFSYLAGITLANLSIQIFINPYILFGFDNIRFYSNDSFIAKKYKNDINTNQLFNETWKNELEEKIDSIEIAKKYTEKGYNLSSMSADLDVPKYQLNHYFKEYSIESFSEWKNRNRILLAVDLINNGYLNTFKLETLSLECGFKSRGNFNSAFFEVTGKKVSEYIKTC